MFESLQQYVEMVWDNENGRKLVCVVGGALITLILRSLFKRGLPLGVQGLKAILSLLRPAPLSEITKKLVYELQHAFYGNIDVGFVDPHVICRSLPSKVVVWPGAVEVNGNNTWDTFNRREKRAILREYRKLKIRYKKWVAKQNRETRLTLLRKAYNEIS